MARRRAILWGLLGLATALAGPVQGRAAGAACPTADDLTTGILLSYTWPDRGGQLDLIAARRLAPGAVMMRREASFLPETIVTVAHGGFVTVARGGERARPAWRIDYGSAGPGPERPEIGESDEVRGTRYDNQGEPLPLITHVTAAAGPGVRFGDCAYDTVRLTITHLLVVDGEAMQLVERALFAPDLGLAVRPPAPENVAREATIRAAGPGEVALSGWPADWTGR
ncbi:MAG: hypothetical protein ACFBRM_08065 [Pikeienuella sp.]